MPTLRASAPASMRFLACAAVTTRGRQRYRKELSEGETLKIGAFIVQMQKKDGDGVYHFLQPPEVQGISV